MNRQPTKNTPIIICACATMTARMLQRQTIINGFRNGADLQDTEDIGNMMLGLLGSRFPEVMSDILMNLGHTGSKFYLATRQNDHIRFDDLRRLTLTQFIAHFERVTGT